MTATLTKSCPRGTAVYSPCERYRYVLTRDLIDLSDCWDQPRTIVWLMLNPSTATHEVNDPTVELCERRSRKMGFERFTVLNLFAYRATRPKDMKSQSDPIGPLNNSYIVEHCMAADTIVAAWGVYGAFRDRDREILRLLEGLEICCLGFNKLGSPKHPLYLRSEQGLEQFRRGGKP